MWLIMQLSKDQNQYPNPNQDQEEEEKKTTSMSWIKDTILNKKNKN